MTPKKQVSPAIRILRGERDVSARATHLEAATRKFLVTTNERKQMSTKTNFKRIALVAVAALGLGVLSSVPAKATINSGPTLTTVAGTATKAKSDSTTAATVKVVFLSTAVTDTVSLTASLKSMPSGAATPRLIMSFGDTSSSMSAQGMPNSITTAAESLTVTATAGVNVTPNSAAGWIGVTMKANLDTSVARTVGTYTYTITATPYSLPTGAAGTPVTIDVVITVAALDSETTVASSGTSVGYVNTTAAVATTDVVPSVLATASTTPRAFIYVDLKNASGAAASESITITTTIGTIGTSGVSGAVGKQVTLAYTGGANYYGIF